MPTIDLTPAAVRTRSPRALAGSRLNRRHPVARQPRPSDLRTAQRFADYAGWYEAALYAADPQHGRLAMALASLYYDAAQGSRPEHTARAASLDACFPGRTVFAGGKEARTKLAAVAGSYGRSAATMTALMRREIYSAQGPGGTFQVGMTPAQARRYWKKARRAGELV